MALRKTLFRPAEALEAHRHALGLAGAVGGALDVDRDDWGDDKNPIYQLYLSLFANGRPPSGSAEEAAIWKDLNTIVERVDNREEGWEGPDGSFFVWAAKTKFQLMGGRHERARAADTLRAQIAWAVDEDTVSYRV